MAPLSNVRRIAACVTIGLGLTLSARPVNGQQDGRKQKITSVRYVHVNPAGDANAAETNPNSLESAKRIVAIVLDDLNMSFSSMAYTRQALLKVIDTHIEPQTRSR